MDKKLLREEMKQTRFVLAFLFCPYVVEYIDINNQQGDKRIYLYTIKLVYWFGFRIARLKIKPDKHSEARFTIPEFLDVITNLTTKVSYETKVVQSAKIQ